MNTEPIELRLSALERGLKKYTANPLAAHMLACVVDACDDNLQRLGALVSNNVPPEVAKRLLRRTGYTASDSCSRCNGGVTQRDATIINLAERTVQHQRCPEAS